MRAVHLATYVPIERNGVVTGRDFKPRTRDWILVVGVGLHAPRLSLLTRPRPQIDNAPADRQEAKSPADWPGTSGSSSL